MTPSGEETILYHWKKETDGTHNPFRYCGEYYDEESGLIYLRNRYYDPSIGRFITEDPARDGLNWYVYANNNPVNYIDPLGLEALLDKYINENYAGQANVAILINRPVANSRDVGAVKDGELVNGHAFIRLDDGNGNVDYIGFAANPSAELGIKEMLFNVDVDSVFKDDSSYDWHVGKVFSLNNRQYELVSDYISYVKEKRPKYNTVRRNCVDFAISVIESAGIQVNTTNIKMHTWKIPNNFKEQIVTYKAYPKKLPVGVADVLAKVRFGLFYGHTPADAAQDMKKSSGTTLLKYNDNIEVLTNN